MSGERCDWCREKFFFSDPESTATVAITSHYASGDKHFCRWLCYCSYDAALPVQQLRKRV